MEHRTGGRIPGAGQGAIGRLVLRLIGRVVPRLTPPAPDRPRPAPDRLHRPPEVGHSTDFRGDVRSVVRPYAATPDGEVDAGEVVWAWVPFEEDPAQGKDRPVLVIGRSGRWVLALPMTSRDHDRDAAQERRAGRYWVDIGSGKWDAMGRPSEVRADRIIRVHPDRVRRAAGRVDSRTFEQMTAAVTRHWDD